MQKHELEIQALRYKCQWEVARFASLLGISTEEYVRKLALVDKIVQKVKNNGYVNAEGLRRYLIIERNSIRGQGLMTLHDAEMLAVIDLFLTVLIDTQKVYPFALEKGT